MALVVGIAGGCGQGQTSDGGDEGDVSAAHEAITTTPIGFAALTQNGPSGQPFGLLPYLHTKSWSGHQSSFSRDEGGNSNADFTNFLGTDVNGDKVMLDLAGPGAVYRIWFTGITPSALVKVYFDGATTPQISMPFSQLFGGTSAPFLPPLVADDNASSGGFACYVPLPFASSIRMTTNDQATNFYYNIDYQMFDPDTPVSTWTGKEDGSAAVALWNVAGDDPNAGKHAHTYTSQQNLSANQTLALLPSNLPGPGAITAIKLNVAGIQPDQRMETDDGRAHKGTSTFNMSINPGNQGVMLTRRIDYGIAGQTANVYVNGTYAGQWADTGPDNRDHWRDSAFSIPSSLTAGKSSISVSVVFVSSSNDWNEFQYTAHSLVSGAYVLSDLLDVGNTTSESNHQYTISGQTWWGTQTFSYPADYGVEDSGVAHMGTSTLTGVTLDPANQGVVITRRIDYGIADQRASVYVDGAYVGDWFTPGSDGADHWRDVSFIIPASFTANKSQTTIQIVFKSSAFDWNEFKYWIFSRKNGSDVLTDRVEVGGLNPSPKYSISGQTWSGERTFTYPDATKTAAVLNSLSLQGQWNGESPPSINAPIGMFFGMGYFGTGKARGLLAGMAKDGTMYAYFPMPFQSTANLSLVNTGTAAVNNVTYEVDVDAFTGSFANVGEFKTSLYTGNYAAGGPDLPFLDVAGRGHMVGVVESVSGPTSRGNLEGDERMRVDSARSPAIQGTGTEDFFNGGWYFNRGPFALQSDGEAEDVLSANQMNDNTSAYREFVSDLVPFRGALRASIEHGDGPPDGIPVFAATLAHYYTQPGNKMILLDEMTVGSSSDEQLHQYSITNQTWTGSRTYTFEGELYGTTATSTGRAHKGTSQFTMQIDPTNTGVVLRRLFDQSIGNQRAQVWVDGALVGTWYKAGSNTFVQWREEDFSIPQAFTAGKTQITIKIVFVSSALDWNEFQYQAYSLYP